MLFPTDPDNAIWALVDDRQGNNGQTLGVAEALGDAFAIKELRFNRFINIPAWLTGATMLGVEADTARAIAPPWPKLVIGTGRRQAIVASYIKSQAPSCLLVQIQCPDASRTAFDLIASPQHDGLCHRGKRVVTTIGAPHRVTEALLNKEADAWRPAFAHLPGPTIALLLGGAMHGREFPVQDAEKLAVAADRLARETGGALLVTTSRRTSAATVETVKKHITAPHYFHAWKAGEANPYYAFLGLAEAVIVTGDSVTMCSEACASGKPVYISAPAILPAKHRRFHQELYQRNLARPIEAIENGLFTPPCRLLEAATIAEEIKKMARNLY